jgi:hypothetical protein
MAVVDVLLMVRYARRELAAAPEPTARVPAFSY